MSAFSYVCTFLAYIPWEGGALAAAALLAPQVPAPGGLLAVTAQQARVVSFLSSSISSFPAVEAIDTTSLTAMPSIASANINDAAICTAFGLASCSPLDVTIESVGSGPLADAKIRYRPFSSIVSTLYTTSSTTGRVVIPASRFGFAFVDAGAIDTFLTSDPTKPVRTTAPLPLVLPYPTAAGQKFVMSPVAGLVFIDWWLAATAGSAQRLTAAAADWKAMYEALLGKQLPQANYLTKVNSQPASHRA
jgi:hypothetical protein